MLAVDQGTSGSTVLAVGMDGIPRGRGYREITQHYPQPGWVEHDAQEIWTGVQAAAADALADASVTASAVRAVGVTNQRETLVLWHRKRLDPICPAIVWQDRRTAGECDRLRRLGAEDRVRAITGLVIDPYFSATKLAWAMANVSGAAAAAAGTVDSWLIARMTGGREHCTDASNASRTLLFDIGRGAWSAEMGELFGVPLDGLPEVVPSSGKVGQTDPAAFLGIDAPITGIAGDQQAALFGQGCLRPGLAKNTYGTGSFVLMNTGDQRIESHSRMLTTVAWLRQGALSYALEGAIFVTGATLQWLRDGIQLIADVREAGPLAESVPDTGGVYLVPAFTGLAAPYWDAHARGAIVGLTRGTSRAHLVRAAVEAMAHQTVDVVEGMVGDAGTAVAELRVDGGASVMDFLCQFQADLLGVPVLRPQHTEPTALGAAFLAGRGADLWTSDEELSGLWRLDRRFEPAMSRAEAVERQGTWRKAVERSRDWARA